MKIWMFVFDDGKFIFYNTYDINIIVRSMCYEQNTSQLSLLVYKL